MLHYLLILFTLFLDDSRAKHKAILDRLSDYFGFKLSENGSVLSVENVDCMTSHKAFAYHGFIFLTKINY